MVMNIQATQVLAQALNKAFKDKGLEYQAKQIHCDDRAYAWYVGDTYDAEDYGDYDYAKNRYRAIKVMYPSEYYACDRYLTTKELISIFRDSDKTYKGFMDKLLEAVEI